MVQVVVAQDPLVEVPHSAVVLPHSAWGTRRWEVMLLNLLGKPPASAGLEVGASKGHSFSQLPHSALPWQVAVSAVEGAAAKELDRRPRLQPGMSAAARWMATGTLDARGQVPIVAMTAGREWTVAADVAMAVARTVKVLYKRSKTSFASFFSRTNAAPERISWTWS